MKRIITTLLTTVALAATAAGQGITFKGRDTLADGPLPQVFLYTNQVVYGTTGNLVSQITATADIFPNGNSAQRIFFLYLVNQATGEVRYIDNTGLLAPGVVRAIDGSGPDAFNASNVSAEEGLLLLGEGGAVAGALSAADLGTGNYRLVLDLRERSGQRTTASCDFHFAVVDAVEPLPAQINSDITLANNNAYLINDLLVQVNAGATLTIEPGTYILGQGQSSALEVQRGARIIADGTKARPIVMTSAAAVGDRERAQWGGLVINGNAPINTGEGESEGTGSLFGGDDPEDSSGILRFVRVEFAGIEFSPDNELNGIAFQGVGRGTVVDHVQVHFNLDDGVEFFGGTVNAKHILTTGIGDDNLDWVLGWVGKLQFFVGIQRPDDADQGIEADNNSRNNDLTPRSSPTVYNATFVGAPDAGEPSDIGVLLREGTAGVLRNFIVTGFGEEAVDIDNTATLNQVNSGDLAFTNSIFWNNNGANDITMFSDETDFGEDDGADLRPFTTRMFITDEGTNRLVDPLLRDPFFLDKPDVRPELNSPALNKNFVAIPPDDGFFCTDVDYIGGVDPRNDWTRGWTYFGRF